MKLLIPVIVICLSLIQSCNPGEEEKSAAIIENSRSLPEVTKILFIGNSHTNRNDIPLTIQLMAESAGDSAYTHNETQPGYTLAQHCVREETMHTIDSIPWDFVILQEQGGQQAFPETLIDTGVYPYTQTIVDAILQNNPGTKIIIYMTQAYREGVLTFGDTYWASQDPYVADYTGMQYRIRENCMEMAEIFDVEVSPAGMMWKIFMDTYPSVSLFNADGIHALPNGSYLLACAIYSSIFTKSPAGKYIPGDVNTAEANNMQNLVYESLFKLRPDWSMYWE